MDFIPTEQEAVCDRKEKRSIKYTKRIFGLTFVIINDKCVTDLTPNYRLIICTFRAASAILALRELLAANRRRALRAGAEFGRCHRPSSTVRNVALAGLRSLVRSTRRPNNFEHFMQAPIFFVVGWLFGWLLVCCLDGWLFFFGWLVGR